MIRLLLWETDNQPALGLHLRPQSRSEIGKLFEAQSFKPEREPGAASDGSWRLNRMGSREDFPVRKSQDFRNASFWFLSEETWIVTKSLQGTDPHFLGCRYWESSVIFTTKKPHWLYVGTNQATREKENGLCCGRMLDLWRTLEIL